jgi:hypothetical protein
MVERIRPKSNPRGAPTKFDPKSVRTAQFLAQRGAILSEIADCFEVTTRTLARWLNEYPELRDAVDAGNDVFNTRVERALAERAIGFWVEDEEIKVIDGAVIRVPTRKYYPPDVTAAIYFTKNRMPERWRDVQRIDVGAVGLKSADELRQLLAAEFKDLVDQGVLKLPAPTPAAEKKMKDVTPRGNGNGNGSHER